jgi:hypothetical protein
MRRAAAGTFAAARASFRRVRMTTEELEAFRETAQALAASARARGEDPDAALATPFEAARRRHPEDAGWLLSLRDRLGRRPVL